MKHPVMVKRQPVRHNGRVVCWWSAGATSAYAAKIALSAFPAAVVAYCDTSSTEHPDNLRFLADCERWYDKEILRLRSDEYDDIWDVFEKTRWLVGPGGARCTTELKKRLRFSFQKPGDMHIFGFDGAEEGRVKRFRKNNPDIEWWAPLFALGKSKDDALDALRDADIDIPVMYRKGYKNNNCIGCVKGQKGYWSKIRVDFPEVFERMAKVERELDAAINKTYVKDENGERVRKRVFLDELDPDSGRYASELSIECGVLCQVPEDD